MADTKEIGRQTIELARQKGALIPRGELEEFEKPDWLIPSAQLAIEVSYLLPQKQTKAAFSSPQLATFQEKVVRKAESFYRERDSRPARVLVYFKTIGHASAMFLPNLPEQIFFPNKDTKGTIKPSPQPAITSFSGLPGGYSPAAHGSG
jgi:hypothetical protein